MALLGKGVLAIWNGIAPGGEDEFVAWHVREHIPERVGIAGFLRGRRYVAIEGKPKFFNFYETETPQVLTSPAYLARLNAPSDWTRLTIATFLDTTRTVCDVVQSLGYGEGAWIEALRFSTDTPGRQVVQALAGAVLPGLREQPGIVGVHLLEGRIEASQGSTTEKQLRKQPDRVVGAVLLIEAIDAECLAAARATIASDTAIAASGAGRGFEAGRYRLQFGLRHAELAGS